MQFIVIYANFNKQVTKLIRQQAIIFHLHVFS